MRILRRLGGSGRQGLLEVLVVIGLFGALVAVAAPLYLGFQDRKVNKATQWNLQAAVPAAVAYHAGHGTAEVVDVVNTFTA